MSNIAKTVIGIVVAVGIIAAIAVVPKRSLEVPSSATHTFTIDQSMERVRKILVRTNAVKKIVAMADAKLMDQKWLNMQLDVEGSILKRDWQVGGDGELTVEMNDSYLGTHELVLAQQVDIRPQRLESKNNLKEPTGPIQQYQSTVTLSPDELGNASIECTLDLQVNTNANWLIASRVEREIKASAEKSLRRQEQAIRDVVAEQDGKLLILPDRGE